MTAIAPADLDTDVCVVGGTLAGLMTALTLARQGLDVILLERSLIAPAPQIGLLTGGLSLWLSEGTQPLSRESARSAFDLSLEAMAGALSLFDELGLDRLGRGLLRVGAAHETARLDAEAEARDMLGLLELRRWPRSEIAAITGTERYVGATYEPHAIFYDARDINGALLRAVMEAGVRVYQMTPVLAADLDGVRKYLQTPAGRVRADHVVLCAGRRAARIAPWLAGALGVAPYVRGGFAVRAVRPDFSGLVAEPGPLGARFAPGIGELDFEAPVALMPGGEVGAAVALRRRARQVYPELRRRIAEHAHAFSLDRAPHGLPLIGLRRQGLWYAAGLGGNALANAALAAHVICDGIVARGGKIEELAPLQPRYAYGLAGQAAAAVRFGWRRLSDSIAFARAERDLARAADHTHALFEPGISTAPAHPRRVDARQAHAEQGAPVHAGHGPAGAAPAGEHHAGEVPSAPEGADGKGTPLRQA